MCKLQHDRMSLSAAARVSEIARRRIDEVNAHIEDIAAAVKQITDDVSRYRLQTKLAVVKGKRERMRTTEAIAQLLRIQAGLDVIIAGVEVSMELDMLDSATSGSKRQRTSEEERQSDRKRVRSEEMREAEGRRHAEPKRKSEESKVSDKNPPSSKSTTSKSSNSSKQPAKESKPRPSCRTRILRPADENAPPQATTQRTEQGKKSQQTKQKPRTEVPNKTSVSPVNSQLGVAVETKKSLEDTTNGLFKEIMENKKTQNIVKEESISSIRTLIINIGRDCVGDISMEY